MIQYEHEALTDFLFSTCGGLKCILLYTVYSISRFLDNGGSTTSRSDWILNVKAIISASNLAIITKLKVQVVAVPGRTTKFNGPVAGTSSATTMNAAAVENVGVVP